MSKHLVFDVTDSTTELHSDNVGAWTRAGTDGEKIDSTTNALWVHLKASDVAINVELDHTDGDSVQIGDGTDVLAINGDGSINVVATATNLDIRDLTHVSDSVKIGDGTDFVAVNGDGSINVVTTTDNALANTAISNEANAVAASEESLVTSILSSRKYLFTFNNGNKAVFLGTTGVTSANGYPMYPGMGYEFRAGASIDMKAISEAGSQDCRNLQLS
jgi:hypothetical protein